MDVITTHLNADFDCLGAMVAARRLYPDAVLVFPGAQEKGVRDYLARNRKQAPHFVRPRELDLMAITRLILVDVRQSERIGPLAEVARRPGVEVHIYDHHPASSGDLRGSHESILPVGATVTVLVERFRELAIEPTPVEATMMMLGLYEDTGCLRFTSTTERDCLAAAFLLHHGADLNVVATSLSREMTTDQVALLYELLNSRTVLNVSGVDVTIAQAVYPRYVGDIAELAQRIRDMENLDALILVVQMEERLFLVGRSRRPDVPVDAILEEFGGGGHRQAASASVKGQTLASVLDQLPQVLSRHVKPRWEARHLMTSPVKSVSPSAPVRQVRELLTRYNINAAPVVDGATVVGIVTRQIVDKAAHHGLDEVAASEFMNREFTTAAPDTPVESLQELIVDRNQRFVPVVAEEGLAGAITRTDLLRHLVSAAHALPLTGPVLGGAPGLKRRQLERMMNKQLPERIVQLLRQVGALAESLHMHAYVVGGFVRDLLLQHDNLDIDVVVEGDGIAFAEAFARLQQARVRSHHKFSTAVVILPDGFKLDIATARMEYYLKPGALPTVEHASLKLDLYRRDFVINALAIALDPASFGELYDFFGAQKDLANQVLRVLHNLSFVEDPTRVFRAVRFEQRLGFKLGAHTESLLRSAVRMGFVDRVGGARLWNELVAILREPEPYPAVRRMAELGLLGYLHAQLRLTSDAEQLFARAAQALHWHELLYTGESLKRWQIYLLCLSAGLEDTEFKAMTAQLLVPARMAAEINDERSQAHQLLDLLLRRCRRKQEPRPSELYNWFAPLSSEVLLYLHARAERDEIRRWLSHFFIHLRDVPPLLHGEDLMAAGLRPGAIYREALAAIHAAQLDGRLKTRDDALSFVKKRYLRVGQEPN